MLHFNLTELYDSGAMLQRQLPGFNYQPRPHIDKANVISYDYSGLWYLTTQGVDFERGDLAFLDEDADRLIAPVAGRFVAFTAGVENLHMAHATTAVQGNPSSGDETIDAAAGHETGPNTEQRDDNDGRLVLSMWFTCSQTHGVQKPDESHSSGVLGRLSNWF